MQKFEAVPKKLIPRERGPVAKFSVEIPVEMWGRAKIACARARVSLREMLLRGLESELARHDGKKPKP
jgi:hypothetical protein